MLVNAKHVIAHFHIDRHNEFDIGGLWTTLLERWKVKGVEKKLDKRPGFACSWMRAVRNV
jgi:hypothetical protein